MLATNTLCHFEIPSSDFVRSKAFYEALFGWKVEIMTESNYAAFRNDGGLSGGFNPVESITRDGIQIYIYVDEIEATLAKAVSLGGQILREKTEIGGGHGCYAFLADTCGAQIGVWARE